MHHCPNCNSLSDLEAKFCAQCGQASKIKSLTIWSLISDFFSNIFNLETKIWRTLIDIWVPAKLTQAFIAGKRVSYYNPLRIFIIVLFGFFAILLSQSKDDIKDVNQFSETQEKEIWKDELKVRFDSLSNSTDLRIDSLAEFKSKLFDKDLNSKKDSLKNQESNEPSSLFLDVTPKDLIGLTPEELIEKRGDGSKIRNVLLTQSQKILKDLNSSILFLIGNITWAIPTLILLLAFFFKILYWRQKRLFGEHVIFHLYGHTRMLILGIVLMYSSSLFDLGNVWVTPWIFIGLFYLYFSLLQNFKESRKLTFFKFSLTMMIYILCQCLCLGMVLAISFFVL